MKLFTIKIAGIGAVILFAFFLLLIIVIKLKKFENRGFQLEETTTSLIIGDSHTHWAFIDDSIPGLENLSLNGEAYIFSYSKLRYLFDQPHNLKKIYIGFGYHNISSYYDDYIYGRNAVALLPRYSGVLEFTEYRRLFSENPKIIPKSMHTIIKSAFEDFINSEKYTFQGEYPDPGNESYRNEMKLKDRINEQYYFSDHLLDYSELNIEYLFKAIDLCRNNGLSVILLNTPLSNDYLEQVPEEYIQKYNSLKEQINTSFIDMNPNFLPDSCFLNDGDHLNYQGAIEASQMLRSIINQTE